MNIPVLRQKRFVLKVVIQKPRMVSTFHSQKVLFFDVGLHFLFFVACQTCTALAKKYGEEGKVIHVFDVGTRQKELREMVNGRGVIALVE